jgi:hypothetical protein
MRLPWLAALLFFLGPFFCLGEDAPDTSKLPARGNFSAIPMAKNTTGHFEILVWVDGEPNLRLLVDTGCNVTTFDATLISRLGYPLSRGKKASTLGGSMDRSTATVDSIRIGDVTIESVSVGSMSLEYINRSRREHHAPPIDGILGTDLLLKHSALIDLTKSVLYLRKE